MFVINCLIFNPYGNGNLLIQLIGYIIIIIIIIIMYKGTFLLLKLSLKSTAKLWCIACNDALPAENLRKIN